MSQIIQKNVRKADMTAQNQYDWSRLVFSRKEFLESTYEEKKKRFYFLMRQRVLRISKK